MARISVNQEANRKRSVTKSGSTWYIIKGQPRPSSNYAQCHSGMPLPGLPNVNSWALEVGKDIRTEDGILESHSGLGDQNTYQWGHPLKEVDALPIIDVVRLPTLRVTGETRYCQMSAHSPTPHFLMAPSCCCSPLVFLSSSGDRPGQHLSKGYNWLGGNDDILERCLHCESDVYQSDHLTIETMGPQRNGDFFRNFMLEKTARGELISLSFHCNSSQDESQAHLVMNQWWTGPYLVQEVHYFWDSIKL